MIRIEVMLTIICAVNTISLFLLNYRICKVKKVLSIMNMRWKLFLNTQYGISNGEAFRRKLDVEAIDKL